ncbi:MAG: hypothetical protein JOZ14_07045 [Acidobacteria bacterium]|nr:hypothetical protein [Acidobacteriota bacterium]
MLAALGANFARHENHVFYIGQVRQGAPFKQVAGDCLNSCFFEFMAQRWIRKSRNPNNALLRARTRPLRP